MIFKIEIMFEHIFLPSSLKKKRIIGQKYMTCYSNGSILFYKDVSHKGFQFTNTNLNTLFKKHKIKFNQNLFEEYFNSMEKPPNHQQLSCGQSISPRRHMDNKHSRVFLLSIYLIYKCLLISLVFILYFSIMYIKNVHHNI